MVVKINAPAPALDLGAVNFSRAFAALGALSFCSLEPQFCTVAADRITAVRPRGGAYGLTAAPGSVGPAPVVTADGLAGGLGSQTENRSLLCLTPLGFAAGMVWNSDAALSGSQDVMAIDAVSTNGLRLVKTGYRLQVQRGSTVILQTNPVFNEPGPTMAIISRSGEVLRMIAQRRGIALQSVSASYNPVSASYDPAFTGPLDVVYGAAESAAPAVARNLRDTILDTWVFPRGVLGDVEDPARLMLINYFSEVYA